ncbi:hypothetical protein CERSUDRAFT_100847 [Gelatoporia subvermispora B]|uniref:Uncharacterized protein n=1 Tax=Ceriporiopsis subvermispora (strain B) TaxID=914234 RepID=M2QWR0_CERS8|nr:hypothetical protein CERSUDRAFT_100847 [Gelatoporia subvermispora B]
MAYAGRIPGSGVRNEHAARNGEPRLRGFADKRARDSARAFLCTPARFYLPPALLAPLLPPPLRSPASPSSLATRTHHSLKGSRHFPGRVALLSASGSLATRGSPRLSPPPPDNRTLGPRGDHSLYGSNDVH